MFMLRSMQILPWIFLVADYIWSWILRRLILKTSLMIDTVFDHVPSKKAASRSGASVALRIFPPLASIRHTCCLISVTNIPTRGQGGQGGKKSRHHVPRHCCCLCRTLQDPCRGASTCSASCTHRPPPSRSGLHMSHIEKCVFLFFVSLCICMIVYLQQRVSGLHLSVVGAQAHILHNL